MMKQRYVFAMAVLCSAISLRAVSSAMAAESAIAGFDQRSREELRALTGRVHGDQDRPIADAVVYLKNTKTLVVKTYITEANGTYRYRRNEIKIVALGHNKLRIQMNLTYEYKTSSGPMGTTASPSSANWCSITR